jgi:hypothetical protein
MEARIRCLHPVSHQLTRIALTRHAALQPLRFSPRVNPRMNLPLASMTVSSRDFWTKRASGPANIGNPVSLDNNERIWTLTGLDVNRFEIRRGGHTRRCRCVRNFRCTDDVLPPERGRLSEIAMESQSDRDRIAEEAVGQRRETAPPYAGAKPDISQEEAARRFATASGAEASIPEKTAASIGERVGDAYSDPERAARHSTRKIAQQTVLRAEPYRQVGSNRFLSVPVEAAKAVSRQLYEERFLTVVASFALGYLAAVLFHSRINAHFATTSGPFQITKPPQGEKHPRGFVESAVLKTITEHPQGMTTAEITAELGPQGIGRQSIASALGALVQAEKLSSQQEGGKYRSAAAEVPTAPDHPSS